jgi:DNA-binding MarR family transcriptional regulator
MQDPHDGATVALPEGYDADEALKLSNPLCFPLYAASKALVRRYKPYLDGLGLTYTQYLVFLVLWEEDGLKVGDLGGRLFLDSGTLTPLLKKLEEKGLLTRRRCEEDERVVRVFLTDEGRALRAKALTIPASVGSCVSLSEADARDLYRILYTLLKV